MKSNSDVFTSEISGRREARLNFRISRHFRKQPFLLDGSYTFLKSTVYQVIQYLWKFLSLTAWRRLQCLTQYLIMTTYSRNGTLVRYCPFGQSIGMRNFTQAMKARVRIPPAHCWRTQMTVASCDGLSYVWMTATANGLLLLTPGWNVGESGIGYQAVVKLLALHVESLLGVNVHNVNMS